ncbi:NAD-dependent epimerase/dehydratase family protein [Micromonospora sp. CPCC 206061]|uniref:NAD-dependent epimerase/dehydratase family protein n=1 Tax=Micromonospora sp. CPCC 206061 TaxID=3122410 RepID=UPI002FF2DB34
MRIVVVGASGNVGTAVLRRLGVEPGVEAVIGVARRVPLPSAGAPYDRVDWVAVDVGEPASVNALVDAFAGAAAVIHLAWQIQPSHDRQRLRRTNVTGTGHVAEAAVRAAVPALVVASSVGAYAPGPKDRPVGEEWPVTGVPTSTYSRDKAEVEALLDRVEQEHPTLRVVRLRPALTFQRAAASEIARFFVGPLAPLTLLRYRRVPLLPGGPALRVQAVHADDVARAYLRAALSDVRGPFNIAADPVLDAASLGPLLHGRAVPVPPALLRIGASLSWRARLQPVEPGWIDLATSCPLLDTARAARELGWRPRIGAREALLELMAGMADSAGAPTAALRPRPSATARLTAMLTGRLPGHGDPY